MTITLYANALITPAKNFAVDSISDYLSTFSSSDILTYTDQNYFKHKLNTSVLLELGQEDLSYTGKRYNYCKIKNGTDKEAYYFIIKREWRSKKVVALTLLMDSITTLGLLPMTNKTLIHREHKDRFYIKNTHIYPLVDRISEGIVPTLLKSNEKYLEKSDEFNYKWYLVYMTDNEVDPNDYNQVNPLQLYIIPEKDTDIYLGKEKTLNISDFEEDKYYLFSPQTLESTSRLRSELDNDGEDWLVLDDITQTVEEIYYTVVRKHSAQLEVTYKLFKIDADGTTTDSVLSSTIGLNLTLKYPPQRIGVNKGNNMFTTPNYQANTYFYTNTTIVSSPNNLGGISLTSSKLVKILELPYCPLNYRIYSDGTIAFNENVIITNNMIQLRYRQDSKFLKGKLLFTPIARFNYNVGALGIDSRPLYRSATYSKNNEPKMLNSEFYSPVFIYDSFTKVFNFEDVDLENYNRLRFSFYLKPSINVSNNFLFDFSLSIPLKTSTESYDNILNINRNNNIALYNNQYLNYLRSGYNYDVKNKERQETVSAWQVGLSVAGAVAGGALGVASGNPAVAAGAIVGGVTAVTSASVSAVNQAISTTNALEQKMAQLKSQASSVLNCDDVEMLKYYSNNDTPKTAEFIPSEVMQDNLLRLFHYSGYKCEHFGVPSTTSRVRFNFIQATIDLDETALAFSTLNYTEDILDDYKARFEVGVTIIHKYNGGYDFEQKYENWETILESKLQ